MAMCCFTTVFNIITNRDYMFITVVECPVLFDCDISLFHVFMCMTDLCTQKRMHFLCLEPRVRHPLFVAKFIQFTELF